MALETGTFIDDLVVTNPVGATDDIDKGDDHIRLIKNLLKATFPNATKAFRFESILTKTTTYVIVAADARALIDADATGGAFTITLPLGSTVFAGFSIWIAKSDSSTNAVTIDGSGAETINGAATVSLASQYAVTQLVWNGTEWRALNSNTFNGTVTINTGAGTDVTIDEDGMDRSSASAETFNIQNSGAGAMTLQVDGVAVPTISSTDSLSNKTLVDPLIQDELIHAGDVDNKIVFGTDTQSLETGGTARMNLSDSGVQIGTGARVTTILDEDTMVSDSATALSTQQATKAYVDSFVDPFAGGLFHVRDEKADGTDGGTATSGSWFARDLNTILTNEVSGSSLASNQFTLPAGTYWIEASAPAHNVNKHRVKLRNITDGTDTLLGVTAETDSTSGVATRAELAGRFSIAGAKVFELQQRTLETEATDGLGHAASFGIVEVYSEVRIWKLDSSSGSGSPSNAIHGARIYQSSATTITVPGTVLAFVNESYDPLGLHDPSTNNSRITADVAGFWSAAAQVETVTAQLYTYIGIAIRKNGTTFIGINEMYYNPGTTPIPNKQVFTGVIELAVSDYLEFFVAITPGDTAAIAEGATWFEMHLVGT